ncbi:hypothetical protein Nepgr_006863 [Nepenthes gracilis]|uniref:Uncharacterized protein n=1 Tax=Nepenthes gracilis TaxID=150966 RepID=A0AAD3XHR8_NEPGR|nr:hypothetical protein Nepgr_006863 [Nepenthes gracilis]
MVYYLVDNNHHTVDDVLPTANSFIVPQDGNKVCSPNGPSAKALVSVSSPCEQGRLLIIKTPTVIDATTTMPPASDMKPTMTSMEQSLLADRPKNILTSFQVRATLVQDMDNKN